MGIIQYYPLSRVKTGFTTAGGAFLLDGKPYKGPYYITYTGEVFAGKNPVIGENKLLTPINTNNDLRVSGVSSIDSYNGLARNSAQANQTADPSYQEGFARLKQIVPHYPKPLEPDYTRGYFKRYFAKRVSDRGYIIEVSYNDWNTIQSKGDPSYESYETTDMLWQLTGPLKDTRVSQYQVKGGVFDTNKRVTEGKAKSFIGLLEFIGGDYTKFARVTE